jgi:predicted O-linked N-acetylglucosamine transferase (SPINDLY family)
VLEDPTLAMEIIDKVYAFFDGTDDFIDFLMQTTMILHSAEETQAEFEVFVLALQIDPLNEKVHNRLSRMLSRLKEYDAATEHIKFIQKINPDYQLRSISQDYYSVCKTGSFDEQEKIKEAWFANPNADQDSRAPFAALVASDDPEFLLNENKIFGEWTQLISDKKKRTERSIPLVYPTDRPVRIGYISPDYRNHAVCHLATDLIRSHNRDHFEVYGYGISYFDDSDYRKNIIDAFDLFHSMEQNSTLEIVNQIEADQIDIAIDLAGYTGGFKQTLFNRLRSPICVNYLGYPGTVGHPQYDFILGDNIVTPPETDQFFSEKVIRLDCCYQCNTPSRPVIEQSFESTGLPEDTFIFCNFNSRQKLNRETLKAWSEIVSNCENSVLWLLDPGESMQQEMLKELDPIRSRVFFAPTADIAAHLGRIPHANLFLDSFPYGAHTTASDALFRGIPVLPRAGRSFQSRVAWSIMHHAGLKDFVAHEWDEFVEMGKDFYRNYTDQSKKEYQDLLLNFSRPGHPYNIEYTTQQIEDAYRSMFNQ